MNEEEIENTATQNPNKLIIIGGSLLLLGSLFLYLILNDTLNSLIFKNNSETSQQRLLKNVDYASAEDLRNSDQQSDAIIKYEKAMDNADSVDIGQVDYKLGSSILASGKISEGIAHLKEVAANTNYNKYVRAYAVYEMAVEYSHAYNSEVTKELFKDAPYSDFYNKNDIWGSYNKVFEYGSSIQPIAQSELRIARYYSDRVLAEISAKKDTNTINETKDLARTHLGKAEKDIQRILEKDKNSIVTVYFLKGLILSSLNLSGDVSFGDPEESFKLADHYAREKVNYSVDTIPIAFNYSNFLARKYGATRQDDIRMIMKNVYNDPNLKKTDFYSILVNQKNKTNSAAYKNIVFVAKFDPEFKKLLLNLGWNF